MPRRIKKYKSKEDTLKLIVISVIFLIFLVGYIISVIVQWIKDHFLVFTLIIVSIITILIFYFKRKKEFEFAQIAKGLVKYKTIDGGYKWGTKNESEKAQLYNQLYETIKEFEPSRQYRHEFGYHTELQGYLKSKFPKAKPELQTGSSRPDIVIADVAIEVKGPTDNPALNTLTTKCLKYSQYYKHLIIVLFETQFSENNYAEIIKGLKQHFPNVKVVRK